MGVLGIRRMFLGMCITLNEPKKLIRWVVGVDKVVLVLCNLAIDKKALAFHISLFKGKLEENVFRLNAEVVNVKNTFSFHRLFAISRRFVRYKQKARKTLLLFYRAVEYILARC